MEIGLKQIFHFEKIMRESKNNGFNYAFRESTLEVIKSNKTST